MGKDTAENEWYESAAEYERTDSAPVPVVEEPQINWARSAAMELPQRSPALREAPHEQALASGSPLDLSPEVFAAALERRGTNRKQLIEWVRSALVPEVDFGKVRTKNGGFSKDALRKPGAEKICGMLGVKPTFPTLAQYERAALEGHPLKSIVLRCHLISGGGEILADGIGARNVDQDYGDLNKALKMALKSAQIDATLRMAGLSEIFTQDDPAEGPEGSILASEPTSTPAAPPQRPQAARAPEAPISHQEGLPGVAPAPEPMASQHDPQAYPPLGKHAARGSEPLPWSGIPPDYLQYVVAKGGNRGMTFGAQQEIARRSAAAGPGAAPAVPAANAPKVTSAQVGLLAYKLKEAEVGLESFLSAFSVERLEDLPRAKMDGALRWISQQH